MESKIGSVEVSTCRPFGMGARYETCLFDANDCLISRPVAVNMPYALAVATHSKYAGMSEEELRKLLDAPTDVFADLVAALATSPLQEA